ncbi:MAG: hypothetical protein IPM94_13435 [bacterium]|nr:hypothetical protein [bacterium]
MGVLAEAGTFDKSKLERITSDFSKHPATVEMIIDALLLFAWTRRDGSTGHESEIMGLKNAMSNAHVRKLCWRGLESLNVFLDIYRIDMESYHAGNWTSWFRNIQTRLTVGRGYHWMMTVFILAFLVVNLLILLSGRNMLQMPEGRP